MSNRISEEPGTITKSQATESDATDSGDAIHVADLNWHIENDLDAVWSDNPVPLVGQTPVTLNKEVPRKQQNGKQKKSTATLSVSNSTSLETPPKTRERKPTKQHAIEVDNSYKGPRVNNPDLKALYDEICNFKDCDLKETAINSVIADGNPSAEIMVIGEAPGSDEDRSGLPFVGTSGQLLDKMMAAIGLDRSKVLISYLVFWRPPGNRKPTQTESEICLAFTKRHIEIVRPKVVLMVGALSAQKLLATNDGITRLRGKWTPYKLADGTEVECMPLLHPAYLLKQPRYKRESWMDFIKVKQKLKELALL